MSAIMKASDVRAHFSELLDQVGVKGDRVVLERHGKQLVALVSMADLALLERLEDEADMRAASMAKRGGRVSLAALKAELDID